MAPFERLAQDVRYAARTARRAPGFTVVVVLLLGLGIGANTAMFSILNVVILRNLPVRDPHQLVELLGQIPGDPRMNGFGWEIFEHYRDHNHVFSDLIGISPAAFRVTGGLDEQTVAGDYVAGDFFPALGVRPAIGRLIGAEDNRAGGDPAVAVVSWSYWQTRFNRDPSILNRTIVLDGVPARVIGVAPRGFFGLRVGFSSDVWVPAAMEPMMPRPGRRPGDAPSGPMLGLMGRLKPGVTIEQARAEMRVLDRSRVEEIATVSRNPQWRDASIFVEPAGAGFSQVRDVLATPMLALTAIVGLLLLLTCTNVASLMLARAASRRREMATRVALGADRVRLVRQVLTESLLLSTAGATRRPSGVSRRRRSRAFVAFRPQDARALTARTRCSPRSGSVDLHRRPRAAHRRPLWTRARLDAFVPASSSSLREAGAAAETKARRLFGQSLVVAQVALSLVLLSAAGAFARHVSSLRWDLGFQRDSVLLVTLDPSRSGYQREQLPRLYQDLLERMQAIPGVRSATLSALTPVQRGASRFATVEGFDERPEDRRYLSLNSRRMR